MTATEQKISGWESIALCNRCGSALEADDRQIRCTSCGATTPRDQGWLNINQGDLPPDIPLGGNQMKTPGDPDKIKIYREKLFGLLKHTALDMNDLRVLELGAGRGATTYGVLNTIKPALHIATEPFPSLLPVLRETIDDWGWPEPKGFVAALDGNCGFALKPKSVNLIMSHGVMHHIMDYEACVARCAEVLDTPGAILFFEPLKEGYAYFLTLVRSVLFLTENGGSGKLSEDGRRILGRLNKKLGDRIEFAEDRDFLASLGARDKHLFSVAKMEKLATKLGFKFYIDRFETDMKKFTLKKLQKAKLNDEDSKEVQRVLDAIVPKNIDDAFLSEPRGEMCFYRN